jgi:predicted MPP superfamily phosphohydrolase
MANFSWLQFSDLHLNPHESFDTRIARKALLDCLRKERFNADYVFLTGDIADRGNYEFSDELMPKILDEIKGTKNVFWASGNHDIKQCLKYRDQIIKDIRDADNPSEEFQKSMASEDGRMLLTKAGAAGYFSQYKKLFGTEMSESDIADAHICDTNGPGNLIVLNTCLTSCDKKDEHNLMIIENRLSAIFDKVTDKAKPFIVIGHHGKTFFNDKEHGDLTALFDKYGVDLYLCGHSHRVGYARFDDAGRDIPQFTCGGGPIDGYSVFAFMHGQYDDSAKTVTITPYSYSDRGDREFAKDFRLHPRLKEGNNVFRLERLAPASPAQREETPSPGISLTEENLFRRSEEYFNFLKSDKGRYSSAEIDERLIPEVMFDSFVQGEGQEERFKLIDVMREGAGNLLVTGEGGMGKTTALLRLWELCL